MRRALWLVVLAVGCGDDGATYGDGSVGDAPGADAAADACGGDCAAPTGAYVSAKIGNDANPGTIDAPVKTIGKGIANAVAAGGNLTVIVGEGEYTEKVTLAAGIDLLGGHTCDAASCTWTRDIAGHPSSIANPDFEGVVAGATITSETLVSGFSILGLGGAPLSAAGSAALSCNGGCPTLRGNRIVGGNVGTGNDGQNRSIGLALHGTTSAVVVENNEIIGGAGAQSIGIAVESTTGATSLASITSNVIRSGAGRRSIGVLALRAATGSVLQNNDITVGSTQAGVSLGVQVSSPIKVDSNRINLDRAAVGTCAQPVTWCAGIGVEGASTTISNNIAFGPRGPRAAGLVIAEAEAPAGTVIVVNNYFEGGGTAATGSLLRSESAAIAFVRSAAPNLLDVVGRIRNNILDGGSGNNRYGLREDPAAGRVIRPAVIDSNAFTFGFATNRTDVLYREVAADGDADDHTTIIGLELTATALAMDNLEDDPQIDATWHLVTKSPLIDLGTATDAPATDFDGDARPSGQGVDIGPDEAE